MIVIASPQSRLGIVCSALGGAVVLFERLLSVDGIDTGRGPSRRFETACLDDRNI